MYLKHYNLTLKPFEISSNPKFLWLGKKHNEALAAMKYGILENKGYISLTGDVGTGKTTLVNALANSLGDNIIFAQIPDPALKQLDFLNSTTDTFKMNKKFSTKGDFLSQLRDFLHNSYVHHEEVVLVIEEAQIIDQERLEAVRFILNIQPDKKLINIVFVGRNKFNSILKKNKPLMKLITITHNIEPLQEIETEQYVMHRLKIAGSEREIFSPEAFREIYSISEGNPRLINIICDLALLTGYTKKKKIVEAEIIRECAANHLLLKQQCEDAIEDLRDSVKLIPEPETGIEPALSADSHLKIAKKVPLKPTRFKLAYVTPMSVVFLLSIFGYLYFFGDNHAPYRNFKTFLGQTFDRMTSSKSKTSFQNTDEINIRQGDVAESQVQVLDLKTQRTSIETQVGQLRSSYDEPDADLKELKNTNARVAELESAAVMREQMLLKLTEELDREKKNRGLLSSELSSKVDLIAELQQKLENSKPNSLQFEAEIENSKLKINELQEQLLNLKAEKASVETQQLDQLRSHNEGLTADLEELKGAKERVAVLEGDLAAKDQSISLLEQGLSHLAKELDQEKKSRQLLSSELSSKADLISEFQQKLQTSRSNQQELEKTIKKSEKEIAELQNQVRGQEAQQAPTVSSPVKEIANLQGQLSDLKAQKTAADTQLGQLKSRNEELKADLEELKGAQEFVAKLESDLAARNQVISLLEQRLSHLAKELDQEKKSRELLSSELSKKADLVSEFQQMPQTSQYNQQELEKTVKKYEKEIVEIQNLQRGLRAQQLPTEPSAAIDDVKKQSTSKSEASGYQDESPTPSDIIDWVLQKKAK